MTSTPTTTLGSCVAYFDQPQHPQCPADATDQRHQLCADHLDAWHKATDARWSIVLEVGR